MNSQPKDIAITILIIVAVIALGMLTLNQFYGWFYKAQLLYKPCDLCISLNPNFTRCPTIVGNTIKETVPIDYNSLLVISNKTN